MNSVHIREADEQDWPRIWPFWHEIIAAGDTYDWDPATDEPTARGYWMMRPPGRTFVAVAVAGDGEVAGTYKLGPNRAELGNHIANTSYMVDPARHGQGIGRTLVEHSIQQCARDGYRAIVFNAVIETNVYAVKLYLDLGFEIIGTIPAGFRHPTRGFVGYHIMHRALLPGDDPDPHKK